jgi:hypothetical protein
MLALAMAMFQRRSLEPSTSSASLPGAVNLLAWLGRMGAFALVIWALVTVMSAGQYRQPTALALRGGALVVAAASWALWSLFARGVKWSYWLLIVSILATGSGIGAYLAASRWAWLPSQPVRAILAAAAGAVLLILLLPKTRHHFKSTE